MELASTKKLLDYIGLKAEKASLEIEPLFRWTANLIVVNRRKMLVVVHEASRCAFVLYGVTAKLLPKLPELILDGIRTLLESEYVRPDIIERYLDELGRELSFRANSSRKAVAGCNKVCERVKMFPELFEVGDLYQRKILPWLNEDFLPGRGYMKAHEAIIAQLHERYGEPVQSCRALELEVSLELHTPCKRRIIVPDDLNFYQFHHVLQHCFEWKNGHLHQFVTEVDKAGYATQIIHPDWNDLEDWENAQVLDSAKATLREIFASRKQIVYEYDFGDGWMHTIELCRVIEDCAEPYPRCVMAIGDAPMEDCGGPDGFRQVMAVLKDKKHPEYQETLEWVRSTWWQPLDVKRINSWIRNIHRSRIVAWLG